MIFITAGSQKFPFDRLFKEIDVLVGKKVITESIFAQIGASNYRPKHYEYTDFVDSAKFNEYMDRCELVITHAGTGAIIGALKKGKKVIAIPRLKKYGEHVDDHQVQIVEAFKKLNLIESVEDSAGSLEKAFKESRTKKYNEYHSNTGKFMQDIEKFILEGGQ